MSTPVHGASHSLFNLLHFWVVNPCTSFSRHVAQSSLHDIGPSWSRTKRWLHVREGSPPFFWENARSLTLPLTSRKQLGFFLKGEGPRVSAAMRCFSPSPFPACVTSHACVLRDSKRREGLTEMRQGRLICDSHHLPRRGGGEGGGKRNGFFLLVSPRRRRRGAN